MESLWHKYKHIVGILLILIIGGFIIFRVMMPPEQKDEIEALANTNEVRKPSQSEESLSNQGKEDNEHTTKQNNSNQIKVDIKGAVKNPGVYTVLNNERTIDVLLKATPLEEADMDAVNLSAQLSDQQVIYVPFQGEISENLFKSQQPSPTQENSTAQNGLVNINTASESELQNITGIGPKKAQDIIEYREEHGGFKSIDELKEIKGIGDKTFEKLKDDVTI